MPWVGTWGLRWLLCRIMLGAGMIKIRGDDCWRDLTCMNYHYLTQPIPNPLSPYLHANWEAFHKLEVVVNHLLELVLPWLLLVPERRTQIVGGLAQMGFQAALIASGNLSFLNWLTVLPAVACFDDACFVRAQPVDGKKDDDDDSKNNKNNKAVAVPVAVSNNVLSIYLFSKRDLQRAVEAEHQYREAVAVHASWGTWRWSSRTFWSIWSRQLLNLLVAASLAFLSYPVVVNILSPSQRMNVSFGAFRFVNSYGAFGSITRVRHEVILQGTSDEDPRSPLTQWRDFEFPCKPGDINRQPCLLSPYHMRADWLLWFAAFQNYQQCPWLVHLAAKLLRSDDDGDNGDGGDDTKTASKGARSRLVSALLARDGDPFAHAPSLLRYVRAELYEYQYQPAFPTNSNSNSNNDDDEHNKGWEVGTWWKRRHVQSYMPAIDRDNQSVEQFLKASGFS
jgi:hypothetical protein